MTTETTIPDNTNWSLKSVTLAYRSAEGIEATLTVDNYGHISGAEEMRAQSQNWSAESNRILKAALRTGLPLLG